MQLTKRTLDKALTVAAAISAAVTPALVDAHILTATVAADIGTGIAILIAAYHGGAAASNRLTEPAVKPL